MAELVRLHHAMSPDEARGIIEDLVTKEVPAVEEIDGQPVILADLKPQDQAMLMLYRAGASGATLDELVSWLRIARKDHLKSRLKALDKEKLILHHPMSDRYHITKQGVRHVESKGLARPI